MPESLIDRLQREFPDAARRALKDWLSGERVTVDGRIVSKATTVVPPAAKVELRPRAAAAPPARVRGLLQVVYEDGALLVINKPAGLLSVPTPLIKADTAIERAAEYLRGKNQQPWKVHRLDRKTSGLLIFAKSEKAQAGMEAQFEARSIVRKYLARVSGRVRPAQGTLTHWLQEGEDLKVRIVAPPKIVMPPKTVAEHKKANADKPVREAITHFRVEERGPDSTLLAISIKTGRRAQIRVQLAQLGHPILGDHQYGKAENSTDRLFLHASGLQFNHPLSGAPMKLETPAPGNFYAVKKTDR